MAPALSHPAGGSAGGSELASPWPIRPASDVALRRARRSEPAEQGGADCAEDLPMVRSSPRREVGTQPLWARLVGMDRHGDKAMAVFAPSSGPIMSSSRPAASLLWRRCWCYGRSAGRRVGFCWSRGDRWFAYRPAAMLVAFADAVPAPPRRPGLERPPREAREIPASEMIGERSSRPGQGASAADVDAARPYGRFPVAVRSRLGSGLVSVRPSTAMAPKGDDDPMRTTLRIAASGCVGSVASRTWGPFVSRPVLGCAVAPGDLP